MDWYLPEMKETRLTNVVSRPVTRTGLRQNKNIHVLAIHNKSIQVTITSKCNPVFNRSLQLSVYNLSLPSSLVLAIA
jgi:hypothetical protein